jgi:predicted nucleotidyltransferase component of viral defense system
MAQDRLNIWHALLRRAFAIIDSTSASGQTLTDWSFGGGTVLMLRHRHRFSKDIDIFVSDRQYLNYLSPRLNDQTEALTTDYVEEANSLKLRFAEGEIDFVASAPLTGDPTVAERLLGRLVQVETSAEIVAKKLWHRGDRITARDIFDVAMVAEKEPRSLLTIRPILQRSRHAVLARITAQDANLRETFAALEILDYRRSYDECVALVRAALD